jgi:hypothetical protein
MANWSPPKQLATVSPVLVTSNMNNVSSIPQDQQNGMPIAHTRIVLARTASFIYIEYCPLCGLEHLHGWYPYRSNYNDPLQAYAASDGHRGSHCGAHGLGRTTKMRRGELILVDRPAPPEYREPQGSQYRLVLGPKPTCFTARGFRSKKARLAMAQLAQRGVPTSLEILRPRRAFVLNCCD